MLVRGNASVPEFVTVTTWGAVATFVCSLANARVEGLTVNIDATPVPVRFTVFVPAVPPFTLMLAALAPADVGLNTTLMVQAAPAATEVPQLLVPENWFAFVPVTRMLEIDTAVDPMLVSAIGSAALDTLSVWLPKANGLGASANAGPAAVTV
jgi:hypothetical protein